MTKGQLQDAVATLIMILVMGPVVLSLFALLSLFFFGGFLQLLGFHPFWGFLVGGVLLAWLLTRRRKTNERDRTPEGG